MGYKTQIRSRSCTLPVNMEFPSAMVHFLISKWSAQFIGGGQGHIWGIPQNGQNRQKWSKIYIRPEASYVQTTIDGGQWDSGGHPGTNFEVPGRSGPLWSKSIFGRHMADFGKIDLGPRSGHGTAWWGCDGDAAIGRQG